MGRTVARTRDQEPVAYAPSAQSAEAVANSRLAALQHMALTSPVVRNLQSMQRLADENATPVPFQTASGDVDAPVQRVSFHDAHNWIQTQRPQWNQWFLDTCVPALKVAARSKGKDFQTYLGDQSLEDVKEKVIDLHKDAPDDRGTKRSFSDYFSDAQLVDSGAYPGMLHMVNTNILVKPEARNAEGLAAFIQQYNGGQLVWSRGMSVGHFAYPELRGAGVLASEGTNDIPTFSMAGADTRWLPGLHNVTLADNVAHSIARDEPGLREITDRVAVPIGVTVQYPVLPPDHVAYLNDGEQVIRGPITGVTIYRVICMGPGGYSYKLQNGAATDLPPAAPYKGAVGSPAMQQWEASALQWMQSH